MDGVEIAPTAIWPEAPHVPLAVVRRYADRWQDQGLAVSGIQSLLYGHPEFQLLEPATWPMMHAHLSAMIELAHELGARIAVFGSPRNRVRKGLNLTTADEMSIEFFGGLAPQLSASDVVLTLEPNAPGYGADYLTRYSETTALSRAIDSPWIQPQVDIGCMTMVNEDPADCIRIRTPAHVHISVPDLLPPPGPIDHGAIVSALEETEYKGWTVLEMLRTTPNPIDAAIASAQWLASTYKATGDSRVSH